MQKSVKTVITEINSNNISEIEELYNQFKDKSAEDYKFEIAPLEYKDFINVVKENIINGFILYEDSVPKGFLLYVQEQHKAIELNIIHISDNENLNQRRSALINSLLDKLKGNPDWNVISYPMLGVQETFVKDLAWLRFKLIGQAIVKLKFDNVISFNIFSNLTLPELPEGYTMTTWKDEYLDSAAQSIHESFKNSSDALFDPRFLSVEGSKDLVSKIICHIFGLFMAESTSVLLYNGEVAGVCFVNITETLTANVPLIGIKKEHKNKGLGKYLLKNTVGSIIKSLQEGKIYATEINAAVDTDNFPALRMYRKIGFKEEYIYPHAYFKNPDFKQ